MKTLLAALIIGLFLSTNVHAKKTEITAVWQGGDVVLQSCDSMGCTFGCDSAFMASYYAHKDTALSLQLLIGEGEAVSLGSWVLPYDTRGTITWNSGCFCIPLYEHFSMVWTLENTRTGRIIDAEEALTGYCEP